MKTITKTIERMIETEDIRNSMIYRIIQEFYEGSPTGVKDSLWNQYYNDQEEHRIEAMLPMEPYIKSSVVIHHPVNYKKLGKIEYDIRGIINLNEDFIELPVEEQEKLIKNFTYEFMGENGSQVDHMEGTYSSCIFFEINY